MTKGTKAKIAGYTSLAAAGLMADTADAGVITSADVGFVPVTIGAGQGVNIDFGGGVGTVFRFVGSTFFYTAPSASFVLQTGGAGSSQSAAIVGNFDPYRFGTGAVIGPANSFTFASSSAPGATFLDIAGGTGYWNGDDGEVVSGFLGVRFSSPALEEGLHYGFFCLSYDNDPTSLNGKLTIEAWAYETDADVEITTFKPAAVPEPGTLALAGLGLLACGAAGLRSKRAAAKAEAA